MTNWSLFFCLFSCFQHHFQCVLIFLQFKLYFDVLDLLPSFIHLFISFECFWIHCLEVLSGHFYLVIAKGFNVLGEDVLFGVFMLFSALVFAHLKPVCWLKFSFCSFSRSVHSVHGVANSEWSWAVDFFSLSDSWQLQKSSAYQLHSAKYFYFVPLAAYPKSWDKFCFCFCFSVRVNESCVLKLFKATIRSPKGRSQGLAPLSRGFWLESLWNGLGFWQLSKGGKGAGRR